jgi:hypothetical protein
MRKAIVFSLVLNALALSACQITGPTPIVAAPQPVKGKVLTLAQVAGNDFTKACSVWGVAVGYYGDVSGIVSVLSPSVASAASIAISTGNTICALPGNNLSSDLAKLNALWVKIQAFTTVPK